MGWALGMGVLAAGFAGGLSAQVPPVKRIDVHGTVVDGATGKPVAGAYVSVSPSGRQTVANVRGRFTFKEVRPGKLTLTAEQMGYKTIEWKGVVTPGRDAVTLPLPPRPKLLRGLQVENARFALRRRSTALSVETFDQEELAASSQGNVLDFLNSRAGLTGVSCPYWSGSEQCYWAEGTIVRPVVYIDEEPVPGGMSYLQSMAPQRLYMIEVYGHGAEIRVYTKHFMLRAARTDFHPIPIGI